YEESLSTSFAGTKTDVVRVNEIPANDRAAQERRNAYLPRRVVPGSFGRAYINCIDRRDTFRTDGSYGRYVACRGFIANEPPQAGQWRRTGLGRESPLTELLCRRSARACGTAQLDQSR